MLINKPKKILKLVKVQDDNFGALEHYFIRRIGKRIWKRKVSFHSLQTVKS